MIPKSSALTITPQGHPCLHVESEAKWEDEWDITSPFLVTPCPLNTMMWTECLLFINMNLQIDTQAHRNFHIEASDIKAKQYSQPFSSFWSYELYHGAVSPQTVPNWRVCWIVNKTWHRKSSNTKLIIENGKNLPITLWLWVGRYIKISKK